MSPMAILLQSIVFTALFCVTTSFASYRIEGINPTCEPVSAPMCMPVKTDIAILSGRKRRSISAQATAQKHSKLRTKRRVRESRFPPPWKYNSTTFPNFANDRTPDDVKESLRHLHPLIATQCSSFLHLFLCSVYSPVCSEYGIVPPCRELCERVLGDCASTMNDFGIEFPDSIQCALFPSYDAPDGVTNEVEFIGGMSIDNDGILIQRTASLIWMEALAADGKVCIPPVDDDIIGPQLDLLSKNLHNRPVEKNVSEVQHTKANHEYGLWCPAEMRSPRGQPGYSFLGMQNCSPPCPNMYLSDEELWGIRYVIVVMSSLCILVTFFTLCTFLIDTKRFRYPERPIVFYAFSYFVVSVVFLLGFISQENAACNEEVRDIQTHDIIQGFTVVKGDHKQACTMIFMVLYYFTVNGTIWWLILTVTWLLAAGFKWGTEAIEKYSMYYHAIAWGIPAVQTMVVVTFGKIEGDNIAGVCFLGLYDSKALRYMLLTPLCIYLFVGITILCLGFCCLNRVRMKLRDDEVNKRKLAKFMLRIGVFSVMYIVPQIILLVVYIIEDYHRTQWEASWFLKACEDYAVPCPADGPNVTVYAGDGNQAPHVMLFCVKYILTLIVALPPLFWVASKKTVVSWRTACTRDVNGTRSPIVTINNNANHRQDRTSSRKALLREEPNARSFENTRRPLGDGGVEKDDIFIGLERGNEVHGSSASVAAQTRAQKERDSRQNEVVQRSMEPLPAPPPPPAESEPSVRKKGDVKKQFPEKRIHNKQTASSTSTSSRVTSSLHRPSSSMSSLTSDKRRRRKKSDSSLKTSSLNRTEFKERLARELSKTPHLTSQPASQVTLSSSKTNLAPANRPKVPPKPRRTASLTSSQAPTSSQLNVDPSASAEPKGTVVSTLAESIGEDTVEV